MAVGINSGLLLNRLIIVNAAKKRKVKKKKKEQKKPSALTAHAPERRKRERCKRGCALSAFIQSGLFIMIVKSQLKFIKL